MRAAITAANTTVGADVIQFAGGLKGTIKLESQLDVTQDLTIRGPGANKLTVSGENTTRAFFIPGSSVLRSATYWKPKAVSSIFSAGSRSFDARAAGES